MPSDPDTHLAAFHYRTVCTKMCLWKLYVQNIHITYN